MDLEISLNDLWFYAKHGVFHQENAVGNEFLVNLTVRFTSALSKLESDSLDSTISYADLYEEVKTEMKRPSKLLETVAVRIRNRICNRWPQINYGEISITKLKPPISSFIGSASVKINFF